MTELRRSTFWDNSRDVHIYISLVLIYSYLLKLFFIRNPFNVSSIINHYFLFTFLTLFYSTWLLAPHSSNKASSESMWFLTATIVFLVQWSSCKGAYLDIAIDQGIVRGYDHDNDQVFSFFGIPYATVPTGVNKFRVRVLRFMGFIIIIIISALWSPLLSISLLLSLPQWSTVSGLLYCTQENFIVPYRITLPQ